MFPTGELIFHTAECSVKDIAEGDYAKKILVLVLAEPNKAANRTFIQKVLSAVKLDLSTDALYAEVPAGEPVNCFSGLAERPKFIFAFGLTPAQAGLQAQVQHYHTIQLHETNWLFADAISELEPDPVKKKKLWDALKVLFQ